MFLRFLFILILTAVSFSIDKTYVLDIVFSGNETIQDSELKDLLRLKGKTFLSTTEFKSNKLNLDLIALKSFYQSQGYLDVEIDYSYEAITTRFREMAYLSQGLNIHFMSNYHEHLWPHNQVSFKFEGGVQSFVINLNKKSTFI